MRNEQLYINNEAVDLDDKTKITLKYKSNLFTDLSKIVSNNSYTIKLPKTARNQRIIGHADLPTSISDFPRARHKARYFRNGIEIIKDATAVLMGIGDTINIALTWGTISSIRNVINEDKKLNELPDNGEYISWENTTTPEKYGKSSDYFYSNMGIGVPPNPNDKVWHHPSVRVPWLLKLIESTYNVKFDFPANCKNFYDKLLIPCLTRKESDRVMQTNPIKFNSIKLNKGKNSNKINTYGFTYNVENNPSHVNYGDTNERWDRTDGCDYTEYRFEHPCTKVKIKVNVTVCSNQPLIPFGGVGNLMLSVRKRNDEEKFPTPMGRITGVMVSDTKPYTIQFNSEIICDIEQHTGLSFILESWMMDYDITRIMGCSIMIQPFAARNIEYGERFPIIANLPEIKVSDFIKNLASMCGLFAIPDINGENIIHFSSMETLHENKIKALDWTKKVIARDQHNKPNELKFTLSDFGQHNTFRYKKDDSVKGNYDSELVIEDSTIDYTKEAVEMKFAASDISYYDFAYMSLYEYDNQQWNLQKIEPRILTETNYNGESALTFKGLDWKTLLNTYYKRYQETIRRPVIIVEKIEISDIDLARLDVSVPVYLGQYGRFYGIISIKAENTGICECELLQL